MGNRQTKRKRITSLLWVEERLLEAKYFADRMRDADSTTFQYELNACLSACRAVTELLETELKRVPGFREWWALKWPAFIADDAAAFFINLRNYSLHQGKIGVAGGSVRSNCGSRWSYRFAATAALIPTNLIGRDVTNCCLEHIGKIASFVLDGASEFPFHACPKRGLGSFEGLEALQISLEDVELMLGFPSGYTDVPGDFSPIDRLEFLTGSGVDAVDFDAIRALTKIPQDTSIGRDPLLDRIAARIDARSRSGLNDAGDPALIAILEAIAETDRGGG